MKKLLLMGTALLSMTSYASAMHRHPRSNIDTYWSKDHTFCDMTPSEQQENLSNRWKNKIVPALLNKNISLDDFKELFYPFEKDYKWYGKENLEVDLDSDILNTGICNISNETRADLTSIDAALIGKTNSEIDEMINTNIKIKENLKVISKISSLPYKSLYFDPIKAKELNETFQSSINLASCISQLKTEQLRNLFTQNITIYRFLQNVSMFFTQSSVLRQDDAPDLIRHPLGFHYLEEITVPSLSLYSAKDGFDPLALAILLPILTNEAEDEDEDSEDDEDKATIYIRKDTKPEILSDLVKGFINYSTDVVKDPKILIEPHWMSMLQLITQPLEYYHDLTKISLCSPDGKESIIEMIDRKLQDPDLSETFQEALKKFQAHILKSTPHIFSFQKAIEDYKTDKISQDEVLEEFKKLLKNAKPDHVKIAIDSVLRRINKKRNLGDKKSYKRQIRQLKESSLDESIAKLKKSKILYDTFSNYKTELESKKATTEL